MKPKMSFRWWLAISFFGALVNPTCAQTDAKNVVGSGSAVLETRPPWLERPWELRYFFYATTNWKAEQNFAKATNAERRASARLSRMWREHFEPSAFFQSIDRWAKPGDGLSVVVIDFEKDGAVKTKNGFDAPLRGRIDKLMYVTLAEGDPVTQARFNLGEWFMGVGDASTHWAPGLCGLKNMPSPFSLSDNLYLYGPKFEISPHRPTVGCREWAYQLNQPGRPYIDITSYVPKRKDPDGSGAYIHETMGWSGLRDAPKPIIGKHEGTWYCLHECPSGDQPGAIADINTWAKKNGWAPPQPPTRVPVFPDPPAKSGTYP